MIDDITAPHTHSPCTRVGEYLRSELEVVWSPRSQRLWVYPTKEPCASVVPATLSLPPQNWNGAGPAFPQSLCLVLYNPVMFPVRGVSKSRRTERVAGWGVDTKPCPRRVGAVVTDSGLQLLALHPPWHLSPGEAGRKSRLLRRPPQARSATVIPFMCRRWL